MIIAIKRHRQKPIGSNTIEDYWRAFDADRDHIGGVGGNPAEAIGFLVLNHWEGCKQDDKIDGIKWLSKMPKNYES